MSEKKTITLYRVQLHGLGEKIWTLCSEKDYNSRNAYDPKGASKVEYTITNENSLFQLICVKKDENSIEALLKVKGYHHVEWFDIYLDGNSAITEQNKMINPTQYTDDQWELINELLYPIACDLEKEHNEKTIIMVKYNKSEYGNAIGLAESLLENGYGFIKFMEYPVAETLGREKARELWNETMERLGSEF